MKCEEILKLLPLYQRGLLGTEEAETVSIHLASCSACRDALEAETRISDGLDSFFDEGAGNFSPVSVEEILGGTRKERLFRPSRQGRFNRKVIFRYGAIAATLILVLWASFYLRHAPSLDFKPVQNAPIRIAALGQSPVRIPEIREIHRETTVTRLKENVIWISYKN